MFTDGKQKADVINHVLIRACLSPHNTHKLYVAGVAFLEETPPHKHGLHLFQSDIGLRNWNRRLWLK